MMKVMKSDEFDSVSDQGSPRTWGMRRDAGGQRHHCKLYHVGVAILGQVIEKKKREACDWCSAGHTRLLAAGRARPGQGSEWRVRGSVQCGRQGRQCVSKSMLRPRSQALLAAGAAVWKSVLAAETAESDAGKESNGQKRRGCGLGHRVVGSGVGQVGVGMEPECL